MSSSEIDEHIMKLYEIKRRLGKGAYGIVWKAIDRRTKEVVAVKKIYDAFRNKTDAQRTFREIMFLQAFASHQNIIKLISIHKALNNIDIYLVFEYMDTDLHNVIRRGNILKDVHKRYIMYQLLKATKYIHSGNVIHRDQKPSNILLDSKCRCKIADFGLARSVTLIEDGSGEGPNDPQLTDYVATRWYRAPEILVASKRYTHGIDMWSLGCILAEMFLGKPLFPGTSTINQVELILSAIPPPTPEDVQMVCPGYGSSLLHRVPPGPRRPLSELLRDAPPDAIDLVSRLLVFNPQHRLTAQKALQHPFVERFHAEELEPALAYDILPPLRDDIQLSVDDYRNKLYELMGYHRLPHTGKNRKSSNSHVPVVSAPVWQGKVRHLSAEELCHRVTHHRVVTMPLGQLLPPAGRPAPQKRHSLLSHGLQRPQQPNRLEMLRGRVGDGQAGSSRPFAVAREVAEGPKLMDINRFRSVPVTHASGRNRKQRPCSQNQKLSTIPAFNSYSQNHGIVTASALQELRANIHW